VLPVPPKREIREIGSRELRRRGIGQHTIEKALHEHVRVNIYRKIVAAIKETKKAPFPHFCHPVNAFLM